jgi:hypothetical protein
VSQIKSRAREARGCRTGDVTDFPRFEVANLREVAYGKIRWIFDLELGPVTVECQIVTGDDGQPNFTTPARIKDGYTRAFRSTVKVERDFMTEVHRAAVAAVRGEVYPGRSATTPDVDRAAWEQDQEARFERAFDEIGGTV